MTDQIGDNPEQDLPLHWQVFLVIVCLCHAFATVLASDLVHQSGGDWW